LPALVTDCQLEQPWPGVPVGEDQIRPHQDGRYGPWTDLKQPQPHGSDHMNSHVTHLLKQVENTAKYSAELLELGIQDSDSEGEEEGQNGV